ncbi:MAG: T9SS type A sorting domain-containing protein, partial [Crocinitomicaceae bacterium]|nr:T9SS type A sorting domain-containing protein [Crocinitomicaceae bacterium]
VQLPDSGFVIVGETYSYGSGNLDAYIVRTDSLGDTLWTKTWGGAEDDMLKDVAFDGDSLIMVGYTESFGSGNKDGLILKLGLDGGIGFEQYIGKGEEDLFNSVIAKDTFYMIGGARSYNHFMDCDCGKDFWLYKIVNTGNEILADTTWTGEQLGTDIINDIVLNPNNDMYYAGSTTSWGAVDVSAGNSDAFMNKVLNTYYTAFDYIRNFGEQYEDEVSGLDYCFDNGVVGIGTMKFNSTGGYNMFIVRVDQTNSWPSIDVTTDLTSEIITLSTSEIEQETLEVYPTLVEDYLFISNLQLNDEVSIFGMDGSVVYNGTEQEKELNLTFLETGFYIIKLKSESGIYTAKFFKK